MYDNETNTDQRISACPTGMRSFNANGDVVRLACDQWKCDHCRKVLSYRWGQRVRYGLALWPDTARLWTLTLPGTIKSASFAFRILPGCWDNLRKHMQRSVGKWQYAAFVELHPKRAGIAHFHIVSLAGCPERLNDFAHHAGFGYKATDTEIEGVKASYYVSKYTSKQGAEMPKGFRRVRLSAQWPKLPLPTYDVEILPIRKSESLPGYFARIAATAGITTMDAMARWEHKELDL